MAMSAMFGKTALVRDRVDARADRTTAYRVDIGPTDGVRILVAGHPGQGGHPRVITATMATNASFRDVIVRSGRFAPPRKRDGFVLVATSGS